MSKIVHLCGLPNGGFHHYYSERANELTNARTNNRTKVQEVEVGKKILDQGLESNHGEDDLK